MKSKRYLISIYERFCIINLFKEAAHRRRFFYAYNKPMGNSLPLRGKKYHTYLYLIILSLANLILFTSTAPLDSPAIIVVIGFLLAAVDISVCAYLFMRVLTLLLPQKKLPRRKLTITLAGFGVVTLALASLGQLTWRDVLVVAVISSIGYLYSLRFRFATKTSH